MTTYRFYTPTSQTPIVTQFETEREASAFATGCDDHGRTWFETDTHQFLPGIGKQRVFKVVTVSSNRNSFGLSGVILLSRDGVAYEVGYSQHSGNRILKAGDTFPVCEEDGVLQWAKHSVEIPRKLDNAPAELVREVFQA